MNAPLPEHVCRALETVSLDDNPRSGLRLRHKYADGAAGRSGFVGEAAAQGDAS